MFFFRRPAFVGVLLVISLFISGCSNSNDTASTPSSTGSSESTQLVILSPHSQEIRDEFERMWKIQHPQSSIRWQDQGGSSDDLRFVLAQFQRKENKEDGIGIDLFFGGGLESFVELEDKDLLAPLPQTYNVPDTLNGVPLRGENNTWVGATLSGFGILYNKTFAERDKLPIPKTWNDLGNPKLRNRIELADPRHSGSAHAAYEIILQSNGWEKGWKALLAMTGNARRYVQSSSQLLQDVRSGEAVFAPAIDFYARAEIARSSADKLGYVSPQGQEVLTPDPIGILRGAPNKQAAEDFVKMVLSPEGQKLWMLRQGAPDGPEKNDLYRMAILPRLYEPKLKDSLIETNPFAPTKSQPYDTDKAALRRQVLDDLIGAVLIENHDFIRAQWEKAPNSAAFSYVPATEQEVAQLAAKWDDQSFRQQKIVEWTQATRQHFSK